MTTPIHALSDFFENPKGVRVFIKREDLNHPLVQGNKWHKVQPNFRFALEKGYSSVLTFGGAFSNHLHAVAAAGRQFNMPTIGIIRGTSADFQNKTLRACTDFGMRLFKVEKKTFDLWAFQDAPIQAEDNINAVLNRFPNSYFLPMGGSNSLGIQGCEAFGKELKTQMSSENLLAENTYICLAAGTGGTAAGLTLAFQDVAKVLAFSPVKGGLETKTILALAQKVALKSPVFSTAALEIISDYHFGGYGSFPLELTAFQRDFEGKTAILLDPVYTAKLCYGVLDLVKKGYFPKESTVVILHSGGLQGR